ncbi:hypothetical protein A3L02_04010 [Thermococcus celer Vu 13 = JCM 8558]|uniref:Uncharacterized protein n=1 Tax=Thermococcus celer Vu 13 = JCM 8558 TaxID=1293037 RepID=A0A218P1K5_THECE|nr:MjaI family restriction endonuclease [Thermococcus celer]ASI98785.1 hypothetical protein A3L02_04010 [Thermococcus celer Vu 13 = JCM 8558]
MRSGGNGTCKSIQKRSRKLKKVAEELNGSYEPAKPKDESKGIDGFIIIGEQRIPVSIKPETYLKTGETSARKTRRLLDNLLQYPQNVQ